MTDYTNRGVIKKGRFKNGTGSPGHRPSMLRHIANLTVLTMMITGLLTNIDQLYSNSRTLEVVHDLTEGLKKLARHRSLFELDVSGEIFAIDPRNEAIDFAVRALATAPEKDAFLVLNRTPDAFIQAARGKGGWDLEFKSVGFGETVKSPPVIFACEKPVGHQVVSKALQLYRGGNSAWTALCAWKRVMT